MVDIVFLIPVSIFFGILSMIFGIGVAPMFLPFLVIIQGFSFSAAIAATLIIELFGFSAALVSFIRSKVVAYSLAFQILLRTVPAAVVGVLISSSISMTFSIFIFSSVLVIIAIMIFHPEHEVLYRNDDPAAGYISSEFGLAHTISTVSSTISGLLAGMTSTGIGEINNYVFLKKYRMPGQMATATSMFIICITALVAATAHGFHIYMQNPDVFSRLMATIVLSSLGVMLGVLIGSSENIRIDEQYRERYVAALFLALGIIGFTTLMV